MTARFNNQPLITDDDGVIRFRQNAIVRFLHQAAPYIPPEYELDINRTETEQLPDGGLKVTYHFKPVDPMEHCRFNDY